MNADALLAQYERIAEAPDAIARLRRFVLDLAVRGKLVPQDAGDEPAPALLARIAHERARLAKAREISPPTETRSTEDGLLLLEIPSHWAEASVRDVLHELQTGPFGSSLHEHDYREGGTPVINPASLQGGTIVPITKMAVGADTLERLSTFRLRAGDIVMGRRGEMGRCALVTEREAGWLCGTGSLILRPSPMVFGPFLVLLIGSPFGREYLGGAAVGTTMQNLNQAILLKMRFGLPPQAEQHRIVAKVDELMALCDRLEAARTAREATRDRLAAASLARLNTPDPETFPSDARFALDALPALTTRPDQIKHLRQTILNLAVRGKLVPQDAGDDPAPAFDRAMPADMRVPFGLPDGWRWARLSALGQLKGGGTPSKTRDDFWNGDIPWVSPKDMKVDYIASAQLSITSAALDESAVNLLPAGSVLFVVRGMILAHSFPVAVTRVPVTVNQDMKALVLKKPEMAEYILRALKGLKPLVLARVQRSSHGTCRLEGADYTDLLIPVPPLAEQHRIVAKVNELMALCDALAKSLDDATTARTRLLDATLAEALAPAVAAVSDVAA